MIWLNLKLVLVSGSFLSTDLFVDVLTVAAILDCHKLIYSQLLIKKYLSYREFKLLGKWHNVTRN